MLSTQLESAVELLSSLQAQHAAVQNMISALGYNVTALESLATSSQSPSPSPVKSTSPTSPESPPAPHIHINIRLSRAIARRLEKIRQWPVVFRPGRMGIRAPRDWRLRARNGRRRSRLLRLTLVIQLRSSMWGWLASLVVLQQKVYAFIRIVITEAMSGF